jgi:hypothetical protein
MEELRKSIGLISATDASFISDHENAGGCTKTELWLSGLLLIRQLNSTKYDLDHDKLSSRAANKPLEWTSRHQVTAAPPYTSCLPLKGSVRPFK